MDALGLLLADGRLPTGGHAHSAGLEAAVRVGEVIDVVTLERFAHARLASQGRVDGAFAAAAAHAWTNGTPTEVDDAIEELIAELDARTLSPHLRAESRTLGRHLLRVANSIVVDPSRLRARLGQAQRPIVAGAVVAELGLDPTFAAAVECHHLVSAVCGGAVKLLGLDPLAIVGLQARLAADVDAIAAEVAIPREPAALAARGSSRSEVLAEWHAADTGRLFAT